ncbi:MAG: hypothetical protein QW506_04670 [Thermoproteota archaeon]
MEYLKESDIFIYDFIGRMRDIYIEPDRIRIDGSFYTLFKLYEKEFSGKIRRSELEEALDETKSDVEKFKHAMRNPPRIRKNLSNCLKKALEDCRKYVKV